jgi:hypothetical protein
MESIKRSIILVEGQNANKATFKFVDFTSGTTVIMVCDKQGRVCSNRLT